MKEIDERKFAEMDDNFSITDKEQQTQANPHSNNTNMATFHLDPHSRLL